MNAQTFGFFVLLLAAAARVGPLFGVHQLVQLEVSELGEPSLADVALVRLLIRVESQMRSQVGGLRETLGANVALVRTFASVRPQMVLEIAQLAERLAAKIALVNQLSVSLLQRVRMRPDSAVLAPSRRTAGTAAGRRVAVRLGYGDSFSLTKLNAKINK